MVAAEYFQASGRRKYIQQLTELGACYDSLRSEQDSRQEQPLRNDEFPPPGRDSQGSARAAAGLLPLTWLIPLPPSLGHHPEHKLPSPPFALN